MMQPWVIISNPHKWEAKDTKWWFAMCRAPECAISVTHLCVPSAGEGGEAVGALHYQSEQSFPTSVVLTELNSASVPKLMF